ncbi:MAG: helix-turn-helix domain-containing protein [Bacilli bacterium]
MNINRLKEIRQDKDVYQKDIAKILNTSQKQYSLYETGIRLIPIDKLVILAQYYNTSTDYLLGLTDERKPYPKSIIK